MRPSRQFQKPFFTEIDYKGAHFLIMDSPTEANVVNFVSDCKEKNVTDVVRVCEPRYPKEPFEKSGIKFHDLEFDDGSPPPEQVLNNWLTLLKDRFFESRQEKPVAVHCIAGYGRAPVLVAVALMELGMTAPDAIETIRKNRKGAFNDRQLNYLTHYKGKNRLKSTPKRKCNIL